MRQAGIPAVVNERDGYFEAQEIQLLLSLLQIIDNPEQDLPMAAVLHSGLVGLDANELGALRLPATVLYGLLCLSMQNRLKMNGCSNLSLTLARRTSPFGMAPT